MRPCNYASRVCALAALLLHPLGTSLSVHLDTQTSVVPPPAQSTDGIPMTVFLTGPFYPEGVVERNRQFVPPGTEFHYYNNSQLDHSAQAISYVLALAGVPGVYEAVQALRPYAFRADLWRYMILWQNGGFYLDAKLTLRESILNWVDLRSDVLAVCQDEWGGHFWNAALAARPREPMLLDLIRHVVANVESRYYGETGDDAHADLDITGPGALTHILGEYEFQPRVDCRFAHLNSTDSHEDGEVVRYPAGTVLFATETATHSVTRSCATCNSYTDLFKAHAVYCDEEAPEGIADPCEGA